LNCYCNFKKSVFLSLAKYRKIVYLIFMQRITKQEETLNVPNDPIIPYIEGDGIGKEITACVLNIIDKAVEKAFEGNRKIHWKEVLAGERLLE